MYAEQASWTFRSIMQCKKVEPSVASSMQAAQARVVEPSRASNIFAWSASWTFRSIRHVCNGKERDYHPNPNTPLPPRQTLPITPQHVACFEARSSNGSSISDGARGGKPSDVGPVVINGVLFMFVSQCYRGGFIVCTSLAIYSWRNLMYLTSNRV